MISFLFRSLIEKIVALLQSNSLCISQPSDMLVFLINDIVRSLLVENTDFRDIDVEFVQSL